MSIVHHVSQLAFAAGTNEFYDSARPSYQPFTLDLILESLKEAGPLNVAEVGAGTGIFTRALLSSQAWSARIQSLKAIEPSEGMREVFLRNVQDDRVSLSEGFFDATGLVDGWADVIVVAQAYHWCTDYEKAAAEFSRILKSNGTLALVWHLDDRDEAKWVGQVRDVIEVHENNTPQFHGKWRDTFDTPSYRKNFEPHQYTVQRYHLTRTTQAVVNKGLSQSYIVLLPEEKKAEVAKEIRRIVDAADDKAWIDKSKGIFEWPYIAHIFLAHRK